MDSLLDDSKILEVNLKELAESKIVIDADICSGKARIKGTRVTVADILLSLAEGLDDTEIIRNFRSIQRQDIRAAIAYAYCLADGVRMTIESSFGESREINYDSDSYLQKEDLEKKAFDMALMQQAKIQEELTKQKLEELKSKKESEAKPKQIAPEARPYDLLIDISKEASTQIFFTKDAHEQKLDMKKSNYIFKLREDTKKWLVYSIKDGVEIDKSMKRSLLVKYTLNGEIVEAIFEGYLTTDRKHKIFIEKDPNHSKASGRVL
jgi:uncharacterized protein (DUF433 family)